MATDAQGVEKEAQTQSGLGKTAMLLLDITNMMSEPRPKPLIFSVRVERLNPELAATGIGRTRSRHRNKNQNRRGVLGNI